MENVCLRCGRILKNKKSINNKYGPVCESKMLKEYYSKRQITIDELLKGSAMNGGVDKSL